MNEVVEVPKMAVPGEVAVGPYTYTISHHSELKSDDGAPCWGLCVHTAHKIQLRHGMPLDRERVTLAHELFHTMFELSGMRLNDKLEESVCTQLAPILVQVLRDNPDLTEYLTDA